MSLITPNAQEAYEAILEVLNGMDNVVIHFKEDHNLAVYGEIYERSQFKVFSLSVNYFQNCFSLSVDIPKTLVSNEKHIEALIAIDLLKPVYPGTFTVKKYGRGISYLIENRFSSSGQRAENVETINYLLETALTAIYRYGDGFLQHSFGQLSLQELLQKFHLIENT